MTAIIIIAVLALWLVLAIRSMKKKSRPCCGDCGKCKYGGCGSSRQR